MTGPDAAPWAPLLIAVPLVTAVVAVLVPSSGWQRAICGLGGLLVVGCGIGLTRGVGRGEPVRHAVGGWGAPLGIELYADGLACLMLLMVAGVAVLCSLYVLAGPVPSRAGGHCTSDPTTGAAFWPLWMVLWGGLNALFLSSDLFNLYVALEVVGIAAVALIGLGGGAKALAAALQYLFVTLLGSLTYLMGVALLYGAHGVLGVVALGDRTGLEPLEGTALALITVGLLLKAALFPLHFWLPPAHASAPTPVSAVLSALVVKAPYYVLLRVWFGIFPDAARTGAVWLLGGLGALAVVWGSYQALRAARLKLLVAYSTVAQLGYLFLLFPLAASGDGGTASESAWNGTIYLALSHACAKAAMFLAAGTVLHWTDDDRIDRLQGIAQQLPISMFAFGVAGASLMGLPPSGGFVAKWHLLDACLRQGRWALAGLILAGGLLTAAYLFRVLATALREASDGPHPEAGLPRWEWPALVLALLAVALGLAAGWPITLFEVGAPGNPVMMEGGR